MKKVFVVVLAVTLGLAFSAYAEDTTGTSVQVKQKTHVSGDTVTTTTKIKDKEAGVKAREDVVTTGSKTVSTQEIKGKNIKMEKQEVTTPSGDAGFAKVNVKKGAIQDLKIDWTYNQVGTEYITKYTIKDKTNPALMKELNLTPVQASLITPGEHTIVSTSPFTGEDIRDNIRAVILKDLKSAVEKKK